MAKKKEYTVRLERDAEDHILPKNFFEIVARQFFPVLSISYIFSVIGVAASKRDIIHYIFQSSSAYLMAFLIVLWVSIPSMIWIGLQGSPLYTHVANLWYKIVAGLMVVTIGLVYFLFPEADMYGLRIYFILSTPMFFLIYFFFIKSSLPISMAYPLNALGFCAVFYGAAVNLIF